MTYSPGAVVVSLSGFIIQDWDSISVKRTVEAFKLIRGLRGINTRSRNSDTSLSIEIEIGAVAIANDVLSEIVRQDLALGTGRCELVIKDTNGTTEIHSRSAFVQDLSELHFAADLGTRRWQIICIDSYSLNRGGGSLLSKLFG